jgi:hypothetical protein
MVVHDDGGRRRGYRPHLGKMSFIGAAIPSADIVGALDPNSISAVGTPRSR